MFVEISQNAECCRKFAKKSAKKRYQSSFANDTTWLPEHTMDSSLQMYVIDRKRLGMRFSDRTFRKKRFAQNLENCS